MPEEKGKNTEELLESLNVLLEKMPGLVKKAEDLQLSRRELEKAKAETMRSAGNKVQQTEPAEKSGTPVPPPPPVQRQNAESRKDPVYRHSPETIPPENRRRVVFLYSAENSKLMEKLLKEIDSVALASKEHPFFVNRAAVRKTDGNGAVQIAGKGLPSDISGLVYLGRLSEETEQSLSGICRSGEIAFLHLDEITYSRDYILDFLIEIIAIEKVLL